jgi:molecular chaperone HscC
VGRCSAARRRRFTERSRTPASPLRKFDEVLLVGGATRMPCIAAPTAQLFGCLPLRTLPPDHAVAMGAAVQAALKGMTLRSAIWSPLRRALRAGA